MTTLQAVTWAGAARRIPRRRNSAEGRGTLSRRTGPGVQRPEAPTTNQQLLSLGRSAHLLSACKTSKQEVLSGRVLSPLLSNKPLSKVQSTLLLVSIDSHGCAHNHREGLWFLTLVFNCSFVSYCSDSPLCIMVTATYIDIKPPV